jgi:simple sugar transport system ATP-binding protein
MVTSVLRLAHISKRFGALVANDDISLELGAGEVLALLGENGAGKSTLVSILFGHYVADAGTIEVDGRPLPPGEPKAALAAGIGMVHQHFTLADNLSVLDNVMLGTEPLWQPFSRRAAARARLLDAARRFGLEVNPDARIAELSVGERQRVEILKALVSHGRKRGARILILDEPTAVLTPQETDALFATLRQLKARGTTVLLITHKLKEIMALCDAVTVMRGGAVVLDCAIGQTSLDGLAEAMVGRRVQLGREAEAHAHAAGPVLLQARGLQWRDALGVPRLDGVSLSLHAGEIIGIAGVSGNGQSELLDVLSGMLAPSAGALTLGARHFDAGHWLDTATARDLGLAHVPEDRHKRGLVLPFAAWESAALGYQRRYSPHGWMRQPAMQHDCAEMMDGYDVRPRSPGLVTSKFSGGNQQKLVLAREARPRPSVLLVGQPTRGVDIGAIEFIHGRLRALRDAGSAVLVVSSELDEILALSDRVLVMNAGRIAGELPIERCSEGALGLLRGGG